MLASIPASILNQNSPDLGIPNRFRPTQSRSSRLNAAVEDALANEAVGERLTELGREVVSRDRQTPAALAAQQRVEIEKWWPIIKAAGIKAQ
jgi:tripartite-type tricarboxylate transporter receptor subunit TctC